MNRKNWRAGSIDQLTGRVAIPKHEYPAFTNELIGSDNGLIHESWKTVVEASWAVPAVDPVGVGNMRLMLFSAVHVAVPAARKLQLQADAIGAIGVNPGLLWERVTIKSWFVLRRRSVMTVIHAVEADRTLFPVLIAFVGERAPEFARVGSGKSCVAAIVASGDHLEPVWKCFDLLGLAVGCRTGIELVISAHGELATAAGMVAKRKA